MLNIENIKDRKYKRQTKGKQKCKYRNYKVEEIHNRIKYKYRKKKKKFICKKEKRLK